MQSNILKADIAFAIAVPSAGHQLLEVGRAQRRSSAVIYHIRFVALFAVSPEDITGIEQLIEFHQQVWNFLQ